MLTLTWCMRKKLQEKQTKIGEKEKGAKEARKME